MAVMNYKVVTCIDESILKENGLRKILNFGHTFGHSFKSLGHSFTYSEGSADTLTC